MTPANRSSPHIILMCFAQISTMSRVWLHAHMKRLTLTCFSTWKMLCGKGTAKCQYTPIDTDIVVLAITAAQRLNISELWVAFGVGKSFRFLAAHKLTRVLGPDWCVALPIIHTFTGCDTVSFFRGRGKRTAWDTWKAYKDVTPAFCSLVSTPTLQTIKEWLGQLERFVVLLYTTAQVASRVSMK